MTETERVSMVAVTSVKSKATDGFVLLLASLVSVCNDPLHFIYPTQVSGVCGNGRRDVGEQCDDGNKLSGDGCSPSCTIESGWQCLEGIPCNCMLLSSLFLMTPAVCGDGLIRGTEVCDDDNHYNEDGCNFNCRMIEPGWVCPTPGKPCLGMLQKKFVFSYLNSNLW